MLHLLLRVQEYKPMGQARQASCQRHENCVFDSISCYLVLRDVLTAIIQMW